VSNSHHLLRINVGFLVNQPIGYHRDFQFGFPSISLGTDLNLIEFTGIAHIGRTPQGLLVTGKFIATLPVQCVRCLTDAVFSLQTEFTELYAFKTREISESGLILSEDGNIDLEPVLREYFLLEIPISPLCKPDCKGLCLECGEDLNLHTCEHQKQKELDDLS
jgi:uncharacterized protein